MVEGRVVRGRVQCDGGGREEEGEGRENGGYDVGIFLPL